MEETAFCFYNVVPCNPGQEKLLADQMIELEKRTGMWLHPNRLPSGRFLPPWNCGLS